MAPRGQGQKWLNFRVFHDCQISFRKTSIISGTIKNLRGPLRTEGLKTQEGTEGLLPGSSKRACSQSRYSASSRARHRGLLSDEEKRTSSQARHNGPSLKLGTEGLLPGSRNRGSSLMLGTEGLLSGSTREPPLGLDRVGLLSGLAERASSWA